MNKRNEAGLIYDYVVTGLTQAEIADTYGTDQWGGVSGTLQYYGFYDGTKGGYRRRFARGLYGLTVTEQMIYDFIKQYSDGDDYYFEDFVKDNQAYYAKKQGKTTQAEAEKKRKAEEERQRKERERQQQEASRNTRTGRNGSVRLGWNRNAVRDSGKSSSDSCGFRRKNAAVNRSVRTVGMP